VGPISGSHLYICIYIQARHIVQVEVSVPYNNINIFVVSLMASLQCSFHFLGTNPKKYNPSSIFQSYSRTSFTKLSSRVSRQVFFFSFFVFNHFQVSAKPLCFSLSFTSQYLKPSLWNRGSYAVHCLWTDVRLTTKHHLAR